MNSMPAVRVGAGAALAAVAREILSEARDALDDRVRSDAVAVHEYRKDMKRWRALLRLLAPVLGQEADALRREAGDLARELAPARDVQAALDALADLAKADSALPDTTMARLAARVEAMKMGAEETALNETMRAKLRAAVVTANLTAEHWPLESIGYAELAAALAAGYRRARDAIPSDWNAASAEELHELRKRVVAHRYQMEFVEPPWPRLTKVWIAEAQRLRERLGTHHDLGMLRALTVPHGPLARSRGKLAPPIAERQAAHVAAAARIAGRLFAEKPKAFRKRLEALMTGNQKSEIRSPKSGNAA